MTEEIVACLDRKQFKAAYDKAQQYVSDTKRAGALEAIQAKLLLAEVSIREMLSYRNTQFDHEKRAAAQKRAVNDLLKLQEQLHNQLIATGRGFDRVTSHDMVENGHSGPIITVFKKLPAYIDIVNGLLAVVHLITDSHATPSRDETALLRRIVRSNAMPRLAYYWVLGLPPRHRLWAITHLWSSQTKVARKRMLTVLFLGRREYMSGEADI